VLAPLLREIGSQWESGRIAVWQEHLTSALVQKTAAAIARPSGGGAPMLFATPSFERHEFGIALAALLAASQRRVARTLGAGVPVEEIARAARRLKAGTIVIGMTLCVSPADTARDFALELNAAVAPAVEIWLGGALGAQIAATVPSRRVRAVPTLEEFDRLCKAAA
jgi:MerR family transcriptional regulator, light-induced transcriptional regulator